MNLAIDIYYYKNYAKCVGVLFLWEDDVPTQVIEAIVDGVADYVPGEFYKRELPCVLAVIDQVRKYKIDYIILDSHVQLGEGKKGLGEYVYEAFEKKYPIIGVAKSSFSGNEEYVREVRRGDSQNPLYVSAVGCDLEEAEESILNMHGKYRIPTMLKEVDRLGRE
ncbi:MAG: endonuclease V [Bacteroidia bacterium]